MNCCKPYGNPSRAEILVIGHDPRLKKGKAEAEYAFFMNLLEETEPSNRVKKSEYDLANSTYSYIRELTGDRVPLGNMYFTNLCNEFLPRPENKGTILIPDGLADKGICDIEDALEKGPFKVIVPMALQVFYHLVRTGFVTDGSGDELQTFCSQSKPVDKAKEKDIYKAAVDSTFLRVCGRTFYHGKVPVVPIVHVMQRIYMHKEDDYYPHMQQATANIQKALRSQ